MKILFKAIKAIILDVKTYLLVKIKYPYRYKQSEILSFVHPNLKIGDKVIVKEGCLITGNLSSIGKGTYIGTNTKIYECSSIGSFCSISHDVKIGLSNHALDYISTSPLFYEKNRGLISITTHKDKDFVKTVIEHDVLISSNALIMAGVTLGTGCVVGAGAFVNKDIPPYAIVVGTPARIIKMRFSPEVIDMLLASKWWEQSFEKLKEKEKYFNNPIKFVE
jgi:acetyltransferase-like isoleucine patch superfamily enzyme